MYSITAMVLGSLTFYSMMWGVWGAPVSWTQYVSLSGALFVFVASPLSLKQPETARIVSIIGLSAISFLWIPGIASLVPAFNQIIPLFAYVTYALYLSAWGFSLFYPRKLSISIPVALAIIFGSGWIFGATLVERVRSGEYDRPSFSFFKWSVGDELTVDDDLDHWIDSHATSLLKDAGVKGHLRWAGSLGKTSSKHRIIFIANANPPMRFEAHYPREGTIMYIFEGTGWRKLPHEAPVYSGFATLEPEKDATMMWQDVVGGRQGTTAFNWR